MTLKQKVCLKLYKMIQEKIELNYVRIINFVTNGLDSGNEVIKDKCIQFIRVLNDPIYDLDKQRLFCATYFRRNLNKWIMEEQDILRFFKEVMW